MTSSASAVAHYHGLLHHPGMAQDSWDVLASGLHQRKLMFGERPLCTVLRPLMYSPAEWRYLKQRTTAVLGVFDRLGQRMLADPALRGQVHLTPEEEYLIQVDHGYRTPIPTARLDSFFARQPSGARTLTFIEFNGESPAAMAYQDVLGELFAEMPVMQAMQERYHMHLLGSRQAAVDALLEIYYEWRGNRDKLPDIAIVDWRGVATTSEFELFVDAFGRQGIKALICDPEELEFRKGQLYARGVAVDFVYKRALVTELLQKYGLDQPIVHALEAGAICVVNPFTCKLLHKKASFALASDERNAHLLTPAEREAIQAHIPWTRLVEERTTRSPEGASIDLLPWASQNRARLVLKPNDEYGGKGVLIGWETDQSTWDAALQSGLDQPSVVQERAVIAYEDFPSLGPDGDVVIEQRLVDSDPFLFHGREIAGCLSRLSSQTLLNVTAGGGSIVPVYVVEERG